MKTHTINNNPLFSAGRIGRLSYLAWMFVISIVALTTFIGLGILFGAVTNNINRIGGFSIGMLAIALLVYAVWMYFNFVLTIKRLHDTNNTGWLSLLLLVPFINIVFAFYILFARGTKGDNNYGSVRPTPHWERILGWFYVLLVPILFTYVFVSTSTTAYQDYLKRAQMPSVEAVQVEQEAHSTIINNAYIDD